MGIPITHIQNFTISCLLHPRARPSRSPQLIDLTSFSCPWHSHLPQSTQAAFFVVSPHPCGSSFSSHTAHCALPGILVNPLSPSFTTLAVFIKREEAIKASDIILTSAKERRRVGFGGFPGGRVLVFQCWHGPNFFHHCYFRLVIHPNTVHRDEKINLSKKRKH